MVIRAQPINQTLAERLTIVPNLPPPNLAEQLTYIPPPNEESDQVNEKDHFSHSAAKNRQSPVTADSPGSLRRGISFDAALANGWNGDDKDLDDVLKYFGVYFQNHGALNHSSTVQQLPFPMPNIQHEPLPFANLPMPEDITSDLPSYSGFEANPFRMSIFDPSPRAELDPVTTLVGHAGLGDNLFISPSPRGTGLFKETPMKLVKKQLR